MNIQTKLELEKNIKDCNCDYKNVNSNLFFCRNWSKKLNGCLCKHYPELFKNYLSNKENYYCDCRGYANKSLCVSFAPESLSELDIKRNEIKIYEKERLL